MNVRRPLIKMLEALLEEMNYVQSQGAGYYTCAPFAHRFNKLREQTTALFDDSSMPLLESFEPLDEVDPRDPSEKSKRLLEIRISVTQLIALLESTREDAPA